jgi:hypothetical protein
LPVLVRFAGGALGWASAARLVPWGGVSPSESVAIGALQQENDTLAAATPPPLCCVFYRCFFVLPRKLVHAYRYGRAFRASRVFLVFVVSTELYNAAAK